MSWGWKKIVASLVALQCTAQQAEIANEKTIVHFVPHSHMDAGWLKTYQQYYDQEVKVIFDSVFPKLIKDAKYTYTVGDIAFFRKYYESATAEMQ